MRTPKLWQKLVAGFKKPFQKLFKKPDHTPKKEAENFFRESGESVYYRSKGERKHRKRKKRIENRSRAVNYKTKK